MKRANILIVFLTILTIGFTSCNDGVNLRKNVTGSAGEVIVVVPTTKWEGEVGSVIQGVLSQAQISLPQEEPIFDLIDVPPVAFKDIFKTSRNIIKVDIASTIDSAQVVFREDVYAWPQAYVEVKAKNDAELIDVFNENSDQITAFLLRAERNRLIYNYDKYYDKAIRNIVKDQFDVNISVPPGFVTVEQTDNFAWFRYDTPRITQGLSIFTFPYTSEEMFTSEYLLQVRDSLYKEYTEGEMPGSYVTTEHLLEPVFNTFRFKNNYATEIRGLWKMENDFMGGPFINVAVLDLSKQRIIMLDGFVYAPQSDKRDFLRQVEAMIKSIELPDQAENDKINSEINMGN